jgi:thiol-disulfide isomerase/thioredoxin
VARVRAPELSGAGGWIGSDPLTLAGLRGRFVLLDFWTSGCVNCLHVLDELRPLEQRFPEELVVLGVHSPKFAFEADHGELLASVERYEVHHPVLDDPTMSTWQAYAVRAWPTLVLVDPEGYVVHTASGEGHVDGIGRLLDALVPEHEAKGTLRRGGPAYVPVARPATPLRFPGKVARTAAGTLVVTDTAHHQVVELSTDLVELHRVGTGERGLIDGEQPRFAEPQGVCVLPDGTVVVADTANHVLRVVDLAAGTARTVAGTGAIHRAGDPQDGPALDVPLSTPWDVAWWGGEVVIAMAGTHQLWAFDGTRVRVIAGTAAEGLRDGDALLAHLAQPSGLAAGADRLWFVDPESSALRWYVGPREAGAVPAVVGTAIGTGLFDFGHRDGPAAQALLQHPVGVVELPDGSVAVCDTYNGAVRRFDPLSEQVTTLATGLADPSGGLVLDGELLVVESAAHRLTRVPLSSAQRVAGAALPVKRPVVEVGAGDVRLEVVFTPPPGQHLDERDGPATRLVVGSATLGLLLAGEGRGTDLGRDLVLGRGEGVLSVAAWAASCDDAGANPACHVSQQDWGIPVRVVDGGPDLLRLLLSGA